MSTASLSEDDFQQLQQIFMEKHYREFDDSDENKLSYTPIFNEYVSVGIPPWADFTLTLIQRCAVFTNTLT